MENLIDGTLFLLDVIGKLLIVDYGWRLFKIYFIEQDEEFRREEV